MARKSSRRPAGTDPLSPTVTILTKLGSLAVHVREMLSADGHEFDRVAVGQLLADPEVTAWLLRMDDLALLPKMRNDGGR